MPMSDAVLSILEMIRRLPPPQRAELADEVERLSRNGPPTSLRDILPASVGRVLRPLSPDDDLLGEMSAR
jgi:hypothetical protein